MQKQKTRTKCQALAASSTWSTRHSLQRHFSTFYCSSSMIVTIDGPSGTGKSTVARLVAKELQFLFVDTGGMFRSIAYGLLFHRVDIADTKALTSFLKDHPVTIKNGRFFLG